MRLLLPLCVVLCLSLCVLSQDYAGYDDYDYDYDYDYDSTTPGRPTTTARRTPRPTPRPTPRRTPRPTPQRTPRPTPARTPRPTPRRTQRPTPRRTQAPRVTTTYNPVPPRWTPRPITPQPTAPRPTRPPRITSPVDRVTPPPGHCLTARDLEIRCPRHWLTVASDMERQIEQLDADNTQRSSDFQDLAHQIRDFEKLMQDLKQEVETFKSRMSFPAQIPLRDAAGSMDTTLVSGGKSFVDCQDASGGGGQKTGVYILRPQDSPYDIRAYCDNGWTVFQRRFDGSVNFYRSWSDYMVGFGNYSSEFWLGLENLHYLTNQDDYTIRIDMQAYSGKWYYAIYPGFSIGDERSYYELSVGNMTAGTAQDGLTESNGYGFSTMDKDNDDWFRGNCASHYFGAWWLHNCGNDLNRRYCRLDGPGCMEWEGQSLRKTIMRIKPSRAVQSDDLAPNA